MGAASSGALPPLSEAEWQRLYDLYRTIPQYALVNQGFGMEGFKRIFWLEWAHRFWGRADRPGLRRRPRSGSGLRGRIPAGLKPRLLLLLALGGLQGAVGWFMVASGFEADRTAVSPWRLVAHLGLALGLYAALLWTALGLLLRAATGRHRPHALPAWLSVRRQVKAAAWLLAAAMLAGGFIAGIRAGLDYNTFPLMDGRLVPEGYWRLQPAWRNLAENVAAVQFNHRLLATLAGLAALGAAFAALAPAAGRAGAAGLPRPGRGGGAAIRARRGDPAAGGAGLARNPAPGQRGAGADDGAARAAALARPRCRAQRAGDAAAARARSPPRRRMNAAADRAAPAPAAADSVLAALPFPLWVYDAELRLVLTNDAAFAFAGLDPAVLPLGTPLRDLVRLFAYRGVYGPGDPEAQVEQQVRHDRSRHTRRLLRRADGACHEVHSGPLPGGGSFTVAVDVSRHQAAIAEAAEQARRLEAVMAQLRSGLAVFDPERRLALSNPAYEDLIGLPRGALQTGMPHVEVMRAMARRGDFTNADPDQFVADRVALDRARPHSWQRERPNGQVLSLTSQPVPGGGFLVEIADITDARRAEDEARRRAAVLDGILASLPHGVVVFGPDGRVAMVNAAYQAIMAGAEVQPGEHREDIARRRARSGEYGPGGAEELIRQNLAPMGGHGAQRRQRTRPNGTAIDIRYAPMPDGGHVQVTTDITALNQAQAEATAHAALLQSAMDNIRHSIALYGPDRRLLAANRLAGPEYGLPPMQECIGLRLEEVVARQLAEGALGGGAEAEALAAEATALDRSRPGRYQRVLAERPGARRAVRPHAGRRLRRHPHGRHGAAARRSARPPPAPSCSRRCWTTSATASRCSTPRTGSWR